jgi:O-antigen/teichoic acid export membrane protein
MSYGFYRHLRPRFEIDREAATALLGFTKYVTPSSIVGVLSGQFDKVVFLRLFDLHLMGLYGVAASIAAMVDSLTLTVTRRILYARCTQAFRNSPSGVRAAYYGQNIELFALILFLPAAVGGTAYFVITFLFDHRYALAGPILQALMIQSSLLALSASAEVLVVAAGNIRATLVANLLRFVWMASASLAGYGFAGFEGFLYGYVLNPLPALLYNYWMQGKAGLLDVRYELSKVGYALVVFGIFSFIAQILLGLDVSVRTMSRQN